jgi:hypothetical protein
MFRAGIVDQVGQRADVLRSAWRHETKFGEMPADRVNQLGTLPQQQSSGSVPHHRGLLLDRLDRHEAHVGTNHRLADPLGIGCIVLVGFDKGTDVLRRDQSNVVAKTAKFARPVVPTRTRLDTDQRFRKSGKEADDLSSAQSPATNTPPITIGAVHLEYIFGDVEADYGWAGHVTSLGLPAPSCWIARSAATGGAVHVIMSARCATGGVTLRMAGWRGCGGARGRDSKP